MSKEELRKNLVTHCEKCERCNKAFIAENPVKACMDGRDIYHKLLEMNRAEIKDWLESLPEPKEEER